MNKKLNKAKRNEIAESKNQLTKEEKPKQEKTWDNRKNPKK